MPPEGLTIDELARLVGLPVRTIREYQTQRLLPPPDRYGRIGLYGEGHERRLRLIVRLQRRGYSLAGIRDLLQSWEAGADLPDLLGEGAAVVDEAPLRLTRAELAARVTLPTRQDVRAAKAAGLICADGPDHFVVRSPALLALVADGLDAGLSLGDLLALVGLIGDHLAAVADEVATLILSSDMTGDVDAFLRRGRFLLLQGVASTLADRLGAALDRQVPDGSGLSDAVSRIRVGAVRDASGTFHTRR